DVVEDGEGARTGVAVEGVGGDEVLVHHLTPTIARATIAFAVAVAAGAGAGCGGNGPLPVRKVLVDVEPGAVGVDREQARAIVDETLHKARGIKLVDAGRGDAAVLRVRVEGYGPASVEGDERGAGSGTPVKTTLALA